MSSFGCRNGDHSGSKLKEFQNKNGKNKESMKTMTKGAAAAMAQSLRWMVLVCASIGLVSAVGAPEALAQKALPLENTSVPAWFMPLAESVDGVVDGKSVSGSGEVAGGMIKNVSAILGASPTAYVNHGKPGVVNDTEDGFVNHTSLSDYNPGTWTGVEDSVLYRWFVGWPSASAGKYGAMVANLQGNDTLVMAAVVANVSSTYVNKLNAGTLTDTEMADLLQGVTADFSMAPGNTPLLSATYTDVFPNDATGVSTQVKDATLVVFMWDGSKTDESSLNPANLTVPVTATTTGAGSDTNGLRATVQIVGGRTAYSNYVGIDHDGPTMGSGGASIYSVVDVYGNPVPGRVKQSQAGAGSIGSSSSELKWGDVVDVTASVNVQAALDGEPDAYFTANNDFVSDAWHKDGYLAQGNAGIVKDTSLTTGNIASTLIRTPAQLINRKGWSTTLKAAGHEQFSTPIFPGGEAGVFFGSYSGTTPQSATGTDWNSSSALILRATFLITEASTSAGASFAGDGGNNAMPINFILGDELGLSHKNKYSLGGLTFNAAAVANASNSLIAGVTGFVDNRPPIIIRSDLSAPTSRRIVGASPTRDTVGIQVDFGLEEEPLDRLSAFNITYATDVDNCFFRASPSRPFVIDASGIASVENLTGGMILGASASGHFTIPSTNLTSNSNSNAGVVVTVTDDARNFWTFDTRAPGIKSDGTQDQWTIDGIAGTPQSSTLVLDINRPIILGATMYFSRNVPGGSTIGNGEILTLLKQDEGSNAQAADGTILGATIGSVGSEVALQVDFLPSVWTSSHSGSTPYQNDLDTLLAQYPDVTSKSSNKWYREYLNFSKASSSNVLGVNSGGLFNIWVDVGKLNMTTANFSTIQSSTASSNGLTQVTLKGTVPSSAGTGVASATGVGFVTAEVRVTDYVYNEDYMGGEAWSFPVQPNAGSGSAANHAYASGVILDTTMPLVLQKVASTNVQTRGKNVARHPESGLFFGASSAFSSTDPAFDKLYGLTNHNIYTSNRGVGIALQADDVLIVEATVSGVVPTLRENAALTATNYPFFWPQLNSFPGARVPALISADFSDFVSGATAVVPVASMTINANGTGGVNTPAASANAGQAVLATFALRLRPNVISGAGDLNRNLTASNIRSVTVNAWDVAGNVSSVGISGATADFGNPEVTIVSFKLNGVDVSSITDATASIGDRIDVYAKVDPNQSSKINVISANFELFGLKTLMNHYDSGSDEGVYDATVTAFGYNSTLSALGPIEVGSSGTFGGNVGSASILYATFSYVALERDTDWAVGSSDGKKGVAIGKTAKAVISATNTSGVAAQASTGKIGVDRHPPAIRSAGMRQVAAVASGDDLTDNIVRVGDVIVATAEIQADPGDGSSTSQGVVDIKSVTPTADLSEFGVSGSVNVTEGLGYRNNFIVDATWTVTVLAAQSSGTTGPHDVYIQTVDRVGNTAVMNTNNIGSPAAVVSGATDFRFFVENGRPTFAASDVILLASNDVNLVGGVYGPTNQIYNVGPDTKPWIIYSARGGKYTNSAVGMDTVNPGDVVHVTASISLNDDPNKVSIPDSNILGNFKEFDPAKSAVTPNVRVGASDIRAFFEVPVSSAAVTTISGASVEVKASDTAGLSTTVVDDATIEVDNGAPTVALQQSFYKSGTGTSLSSIVSGKSAKGGTVGPATFEAVMTVEYTDGGTDTASTSSGSAVKDLPGLVLASANYANTSATPLVLLATGEITGKESGSRHSATTGVPNGPLGLWPDFFKIEGAGPTVTSSSSKADIQASTNRTVTYYFWNLKNGVDVATAGKIIRGAAVPKQGYFVGSSSGLSSAAAKLIGYASDDIGNVAPGASTLAAGSGAGIFTIELDNNPPALASTRDVAGNVVSASLLVISSNDMMYEATQPAVNSGDVVEVSFAISDPVNNTTPLTVSFDLKHLVKAKANGYSANDSPSVSNLAFLDATVASNHSPQGSYNSDYGIYTITGIEPVAHNIPAQGSFRFNIGGADSSDPVSGGARSNIFGASVLIAATDAIGLPVGGNPPNDLVYSSTVELDNQAPSYLARRTFLPSSLVDGSGNDYAKVHVAALQPEVGGGFQLLDPPSVTAISQDPANPTLIRASATVRSDSLVTFDSNLKSIYNADGQTRVEWYPSIGNTDETLNATRAVQISATEWLLNATVKVVAGAQPIQPQKVVMNAYDQVGNKGTSDTANVLGINAQGVFLLESSLYVKGTNVSLGGQGGAAQTPAVAADRTLTGAGVDELRPGDLLTFVATISHDTAVPDYLTANFSEFYELAQQQYVTYLVPSATQAAAGNTTIATWEIATVDVAPFNTVPEVTYASLWIGNATPISGPLPPAGAAAGSNWNNWGDPTWNEAGRQGLQQKMFDEGSLSIASDRAAMPGLLGSPKIAIQNVWNVDTGSGVPPTKAASVVVTATDNQSLFPPTSMTSTEVIVDTQPPEVITTLTPLTPATFRNASGDTPNRITVGDTVRLFVRLVNPTVDGQSDDHWSPVLPGQVNGTAPTIIAHVTPLGIPEPQRLVVTNAPIPTATAQIYEVTADLTVGSGVGDSDLEQQTIVNVIISASDDVGNEAVEIIHEQPIAVDDWPPSIFTGSLGVRLLSGTATTAAGGDISVGQFVPTNSSIAPGSILRVSAVIGDTLDDPLTFLTQERISLDTSGIPSAGVRLVTEEATISRTNLSAPFNVTLPGASSLETTLGFGFTVSVTDSLDNGTTQTGIGQFNVNGKPVYNTLATTSDGLLARTSVQDGDTLAMNGDSVLTLEVGAFDLGSINSLSITNTPAAPTGLTVSTPATTPVGLKSVTGTVTVTPDTPTYGAAAPQGVQFQATATDDDALTATLSGINVTVNSPAIFDSVFDATVEDATVDFTGTPDAVLSAAGADVREVTLIEGQLLTVLIDAADMSAPSTITLSATGTAIASDMTIEAATFAGVDVAGATTTQTASIDGSGVVEFNFAPGFEAIPFGSTVSKVTFELNVSAADSLQTNADDVTLLINVTPEAQPPVVTITDVTILNAAGATGTSLGGVSTAVVQETSTAVITASARDLGGEPVTVTFGSSSSVSIADSNVTDPAAGQATVGSVTVPIGLNDADNPGTNWDVATDPTTITVTGTNNSGLTGTAEVVLDLLNLSQPPVISVTATVNGEAATITDNTLNTRPGDVVTMGIRVTDSDAEILLLEVSGLSGELSTEPTKQGLITGEYTFTIPSDLAADASDTVELSATDGGFLTSARTITVNMLAGNHAPVLTLDPTEASGTVGEALEITVSAEDIDGDAVAFDASVGTFGPITKVGNTSTALLSVVPTEAGTISVEVTATDGDGASDTATATLTIDEAPVTPTPTALPGTVIVSQGYGGTGSSIRVDVSDPTDVKMVPKSAFPGMPPTFATAINSPRTRSANVAVADIDGDGTKDMVVGFGPGGFGADFPSSVVAWTPTGGGTEGDRPSVITAKNVFNPNAPLDAYKNVHGALNLAAGTFFADQTLPIVVAAQGLGGSNQIALLQYAEETLGEQTKKKLNIVGYFQGLSGAAAQLNTSGGTSVATGDVDGDGLDELIVGQMNGATATTLFQVVDLQKVDGVISVQRRTAAVQAMPNAAFFGEGGVNLAIGDVDGDGDQDIVTATAGDAAGANNPDLKNFVRVFQLATDDQNRITTISQLTPPIQILGSAVSPSGAIDVACGNADTDIADEVIVSAQALISLDTETGEVSYTNTPFEGKNFYKVWNLNFADDGSFGDIVGVTPLLRAFQGDFAPTSGSLFVEMMPAN